ncbi:hypothetical protein N7457_007079 [Penicillium paradoxum]|uniref:uncharacterized protein n=1 Tax=Penicillium paradoxum TaxID=176176 RepID=UPI0025490047|nr:uncharacterized protein N7457_007079 [Penicillium paradoxum]KAJ5779359.1 hypothetical protein N7457_007079 [Penicillium paradoxum]
MAPAHPQRTHADVDGATVQMAGPALSQCSNSTWDLYQANGFFCCEPGDIGFTSTEQKTRGYLGCAKNGTLDEDVMSPISDGNNVVSTSTSATAPHSSTIRPPVMASPTVTPSTTPTPSEHSTANTGTKINKGAIAGGVVGGSFAVALIVVIAWLILRRRRSKASVEGEKTFPGLSGDSRSKPSSTNPQAQPLSELSEERGSGMCRESTTRAELPARQVLAELPEHL